VLQESTALQPEMGVHCLLESHSIGLRAYENQLHTRLAYTVC